MQTETLNAVKRLPEWFKQELPGKDALALSRLLNQENVNTVCRSARCPNSAQCFAHSRLTFLILGNDCTRGCAFCNIQRSFKPAGPDEAEPERLAGLVSRLGLNYVTLTSVARDDLPDGGALHFVRTINAVRARSKAFIEVLIPDFGGESESLRLVCSAWPDIIAHNLETVPSLYPLIRPRADFRRSLEILRKVKEFDSRITTKSSLMLGMGEDEEEVRQTLSLLRQNHCDIVTLGQYLAPSPKHYPVKEYIRPEKFAEYKRLAEALGFLKVISGPKIRSSYKE